ncbi:DUF7527 domain-containing protein [Natronorubrum sulfidifaciens]|uniref:DUF7527 domain-containing protein n=1 Tax=Natronorubrum sulfidifaciens JCM 14089 TaxID=1230460 RepID=L9W315_9EURY|nr:hypothetical protein [Natronorubrum sulfidifaciens]ELY43835.1 hypothetical protein C495_12260 [Natronorubrum sulfidifaciens JCM 14089]
MNSRTQERVEQWDSHQFDGGYDGLADLAAADFSGAVVAAGTWLFLLNGRIVGVVDGSISDFETSSGTVYEAPHPSLPLLSAMEEGNGDTRAKYYTNETPLHEVDETLQSGSFTGYVELSENVLSGDYYAVYYGGRRMAAAYIGNAEQLLTGDEAFDRADDEVGIYEVIDVDIDVTDVPGTDATESVADEHTDDTEPESPSTAIADDGQSTQTQSDPTSELSADPTESAIESIDISGTEPTTDDETPSSASIEDLSLEEPATESTAETTDIKSETSTDDRASITAPDDSEPAPPSSGITDTAVTTGETESTPAVDDRSSLASSSSESVVEQAATDESSDDAVDQEAAERDSMPDVDDVAISDTDTDGDDETVEATTGDAAHDGDAVAEAETEEHGRSALDPATVEKAAAQLDQNDISWTEDDVDSASDDVDVADSERFEQEAQWRETRRIPSIDPDNTETAASTRDGRDGGRGDTSAQPRSTRPSSESTATEPASTHRQQSETTTQTREESSRAARAEPDSSTSNAASTADTPSRSEHEQRIAALTQRLETREQQRETLVATVEELEAERDRLRAENEELSTTVDRLRARIEELQTDLEDARAATAESATNTPETSTSLPAQQALAETNLFVRYGSKSQPTLETAHDGEADRTEVASNLRLEYHTGFDASDVAVDGTPYEEFLTATMEYRFVDWLTELVLYEIRDTGNANGLGDLYDAIPRIDRAELDATISLADDDTEDVPERVTFDIVAFDKMGNPLVVVNLNDSREPATQGMLEEMEEAASAVKANYPDLAAATVVTSSYFEPGALEVAEQATSGGFLSRSSKLSYVNLSRKQGYHLCLVESRSEGFHMNVPEL